MDYEQAIKLIAASELMEMEKQKTMFGKNGG